MNIDGDYLWDRSGEPDPEIQQLEETLGTLRYQPRPLEIPAALEVGRNGNFFRAFGPRLAIAATIAIIVLGLGLWFGLQRLQHSQQPVVSKTGSALSPARDLNPKAVVSPSEKQNSDFVASTPVPDKKLREVPHRHRVNTGVVAANKNRSGNAARDGSVKNSQLAANKLKEGEAAKDQLMLALRVASAKLNFAQKKTQNINPRDLIHNQHKIG
jgi:hypothetical protein